MAKIGLGLTMQLLHVPPEKHQKDNCLSLTFKQQWCIDINSSVLFSYLLFRQLLIFIGFLVCLVLGAATQAAS